MAFLNNSNTFRALDIATNDLPVTYHYKASADSFATVAAADYFADLLYKVRTGDKLICNTSTGGLSFSGTFVNNGLNVSVAWDNTLRFESEFVDVSTAATIYTSVVPAGIITQVYAIQYSAVTVASSIITFSLGATPITGGALTVTTAGVAGTAYSATPTALNVTSGSTGVKVATDGGSTTAAIVRVGVQIICPTTAAA